MNTLRRFSRVAFVLLAAGTVLPSIRCAAEAAPDAPYKIINSVEVPGTGGIDYVYADSDARRLYVPRGDSILTFDLDTLKQGAPIATTGAHGVAVDAKSHHGFGSSNPVVMWDAVTLKTIKTIAVQGDPDGILFEPQTERIFVFSHAAPNATVINAADGTIAGTIDLGGAPEQAVSDGEGHLYVDIKDKGNVAVVDLATLKVIAHHDLGGKKGPAGLALDASNHVLFAFCREPAAAVMLNAQSGEILGTLPIGAGTDGGGFNPATMEAFSSQRDGTLTIIKKSGPDSFGVEQTLKTMPGAKTCTLDAKTNRILLIAVEKISVTPGTAVPVTPLHILVVGR